MDDVGSVEAALLNQRAAGSRRISTRLVLGSAGVAALLVAALLALSQIVSRDGTHRRAIAPHAVHVAARAAAAPLRPHPRIVVALAPGQSPPASGLQADAEPTAAPTAPARAPTDAEIRHQLTAFRKELGSAATVRGAPGSVLPDGRAVVPVDAPAVVAAVITAGNEIATKPYKWGGGHGAWADTGYDCSGSLSFALAGAGLVGQPLDSTGFMSFGDPGPGRWITIYANGGHTFMIVAGLRFDTSGAQGSTRWQRPERGTAGFAVRHPRGL